MILPRSMRARRAEDGEARVILRYFFQDGRCGIFRARPRIPQSMIAPPERRPEGFLQLLCRAGDDDEALAPFA